MTSSYSLIETLLSSDRDPASIVAISDVGPVDWRSWKRETLRWISFFRSRSEERWVLYCDSSLRFSQIFFALLHAGKTIFLAGNSLPGTQKHLYDSVDAFVGDFEPVTTNRESQGKTYVQHLNHKGFNFNDDEPDVRLESIDINVVKIYLYTSGSTGKPETIPKTLGQLSRESTTLINHWHTEYEDALVLATVSHQHMYGLLFRVLVPLSIGTPFLASICAYSEDILRSLSLSNKIVLVSSPSHLTRLSSNASWQDNKDRFSCIFSSTAPLSFADALEVKETLGKLPIEIYGTSETGGIAWRSQLSNEQPFNLLDGLTLHLTENIGRYLLESPHMGSMDGFLLEDIIQQHTLTDFSLHGRGDNIVKVEGKRINLSELEQAILNHPFVTQARCIWIHENRDFIATVVALSNEGFIQLKKQGKLAFNKLLVEHLRPDFEPVIIPRKFRFSNRLPVNQQGKTTQVMLQDMVGRQSLVGRLPSVVLYEQLDELKWAIQFEVPPSLIFFQGHFEGQPVLPGMAMIFWAEYYANILYTLPNAQSLKLTKSKFQSIVLPGTRLFMTIEYNPSNSALQYTYESSKGIHSSGFLILST